MILTPDIPWPAEARLLLRLDARRVAAALRRPEAGVWIGVLLPLAVVIGVAWTAGAAAVPDVADAEGAVALGILVAAPVAFLAYGVLFRPRDDAFLRRLGLGARALYAERAARLLAAALGIALLVLVPFAAARVPLARPAVLALGVALAAWAASLLTTGSAAAAIARDPSGRSHALLSMGMWDRELARAAPLVWAPVPPLLAGAVSGGFLGTAAGVPGARLLLVAAISLGAAALAARPFARALPHFAPRALEMAFAPPPAAGETGLVLGRGLARLLPQRIAAVRARDAAVAARRYRWAATIV
ncbi:MAG TPA: hypothetical protein VFX29_08795, partial [Longimicrobiaceae bacterium]|nr:hypothetical protein [Longimicrobiaceae bacterium]